MTKAKISEYDAVAANNTDVNGVNIAEGCPPSGMNNMGREIMAALKRFQVGSDGDGVTVGGNLVVSGSSTVNTFTAGPVSATTLNTSGAVVFNDAGADVDFRVEGDTDANLLFVDASTDRVGIGTSSPATKFVIGGASGNYGLQIAARTDFSGISGQLLLTDSTGSACMNTVSGALTFSTGATVGTDSGSERMRIDSSGNVGIGTTPSYKLHVVGGQTRLDVSSAGTSLVCLGTGSNFQVDHSTSGYATLINSANTGAGMIFKGSQESMRIDTSGDLLVGATSSNGRITGQSSTSDSSSFALGTKNSSSTDLFRVRGDGALYLGLAGSSPYNLTTGVAANAYLETNGYLYRSTSSRKYKTQIEDIDASRSQAILNFRPVWYRSLCKDDNKSWSYYGLIAEEVAEIEPRLVFWGYNENDYEEVTTETPVERERTVTDENGNETIETYTEVETKTERKLKEDAQLAPEGVQYERLTVLLLDVVKRQDASIKALEARIAALENA